MVVDFTKGSFHYFRSLPELWKDRLLKMKAGGLNTVEVSFSRSPSPSYRHLLASAFTLDPFYLFDLGMVRHIFRGIFINLETLRSMTFLVVLMLFDLSKQHRKLVS
jgi:hypothetical protein